jgi:hypothetical protein
MSATVTVHLQDDHSHGFAQAFSLIVQPCKDNAQRVQARAIS